MLQYEETTGAWSEIGRVKKARYYHAVVAVDKSLYCPGIVVRQIRKNNCHHHHRHHHLIITPTLSHSLSN